MMRILVVDDDTTCLTIVATFLKRWNYQVMTVKHPRDALCTLRIKGVSFDLVVADVHMPDMNGFELQQQINHEFNLPVVLMSADNEEGVIVKGIESGAAFFIVKPVSSEDLKDLWQYATTSTTILKSGEKAATLIMEEIGDKSIADESCNEALEEPAAKGDSRNDKRKLPRKDNDKKRSDYNVDSDTTKRAKVVWTNALHHRFLEAIRILGNDKKIAVPRTILEVMKFPGLTREQVASHLQKYKIFLKRVSDASCKVQLSVLADQSSFASGNHGAVVMHDKLKQQQMRSSSSLHQRIGGHHNYINPAFNSSNLSSVSCLNQEAPKSKAGQFQLLRNQGLPYGVGMSRGGINSMLMYQPPTQNFLSDGLSTCGVDQGLIGSVSTAANETMGNSSISSPMQNLSSFNRNHIGYNQTPAGQNEVRSMNKYPSICYDSLSQQPCDPGDLSNIQSLNETQNELEDSNFGTSIGSNHVGNTPIMNGQSSKKQLGSEEVTATSFDNNVILSWFDRNPNQQHYHGGIYSQTPRTPLIHL